MKKWIILITLTILTNCKSENGIVYFTNQKAIEYFNSIDELCNNENGRTWGKNLYGPIMFVDRQSRRIYANEADNDGILKYKDGIYTGLYPKELVIGNSQKEFGGVLFAIVPIPAEEDPYRIKTRVLTELFKRFQATRGLTTGITDNRHINEKNARFWLKLEWKALSKAINSSGEERMQSLRDALIFRGARHELYYRFQNGENKVENSEGLPNFTSVLFCTESEEELKSKFTEQITLVYGFSSYTYSFGTLNGALYSYFLHDKGFNFVSLQSLDEDLGKLTQNLYGIELPEICRDVAGSLALNYDIDGIYKEEEKREVEIKERINNQIGIFIDQPVVYLELESPYFGFEPEDVHPLDTLGTLYSTLRVSDNWGKITIDSGGGLVENNLKYLRITASNLKDNKTQITGEGWVLILDRKWKLEKVDQNYFIRRVIP